MKLIALCHDALPSRSTYTQQLVWTNAELTRVGFDVEVLARNSGKNGPALREWITSYYALGSLPDSIRFTPIGTVARNGTLTAGLTDVLNVLRARKDAPDILLTRDVFALALALAAGLPCVFETYKVSINKDAKFAAWRSFCYSRKNLLGIVTHSEVCRRSFIDAGFAEKRVETIYNGFSQDHFASQLSRSSSRAQLNLNGAKHIVTYAGHVDLKKGVEIVLRIAMRLPDVKFLIVGANPGSDDKKQVLQKIREIGAANVSLLDRVPLNEVPNYLFASDCLIIPPSAAPLRKHRHTILPMKTFSYLAAGRPIIAPDLVDLREMLRPNENALLVAPDNIDAAAENVLRIINDERLAGQLGATALRDAAQFTWAKRAERLAKFLQRVSARSGQA